jgi:hypothetical protein
MVNNQSLFSGEIESMIVIQTNSEWNKINSYCTSSWLSRAKELGYQVKFINYTEYNESFINILYKECLASGASFVIVFFDDLYCQKFDIPDYLSVNNVFKRFSPDAVRLDGRVPPSKNLAFSSDGTDYYVDHRARRYQFSTVGTAFSAQFLKKMVDKGVNSAWDIENLIEDGFKVYAVRKKNIKYINLIVKGKLDLVALLQTHLRLALLTSLVRLLNRSSKKFIRYFQ